jgi:phosphate transport system protein
MLRHTSDFQMLMLVKVHSALKTLYSLPKNSLSKKLRSANFVAALIIFHFPFSIFHYMKYTEKELAGLLEQAGEMWRLVLSQLEKARQAYMNVDVELAREVVAREKRVDTFELKIEGDCENFIALFAPVAVDLRLVLSLIKISGTLERIGDFAEGIARDVVAGCVIPELLPELKIGRMLETVASMLADSYTALEHENTRLAGRIMRKDEEVDALYRNAIEVLAAWVARHPDKGREALETMVVLRKIERIGDHCNNIVEEIVFYIDAKILKHKKKKR